MIHVSYIEPGGKEKCSDVSLAVVFEEVLCWNNACIFQTQITKGLSNPETSIL